MKPWLEDADLRLYVGDALEVLRQLPDGSVDCCVTSPPYWSLRDYGVPGQLGLEETPNEFVAAMVAVFREVRRVLAPHGTCWVNLGDSYAGSWGAQGRKAEQDVSGVIHSPECDPDEDCGCDIFQGLATGYGTPEQRARWRQSLSARQIEAHPKKATRTGSIPKGSGLKPKDLVGIPWRVAFALQADGWWLRSAITWCKPNCMPESVTDRPTKATEIIFLLTKAPRYFYDAEAVREPHQYDGRKKLVHDHAVNGSHENYANMGTAQERWPGSGRNMRDWWEIATQPYPEAHFATFPEELPRRAIAAGCPLALCRVCGKPRERIVEQEVVGQSSRWVGKKRADTPGQSVSPSSVFRTGEVKQTHTAGWSDCGHQDYRPGVVLDPFAGSGTTLLVARKLGRHSIGIELNESYAELCARRTRQLSLLSEGAA